MTSDTKIGLLLGLVFIFVIAFLIQGLPSFRAHAHGNNTELADVMAQVGTQPTGIAEQARQVQASLTPQRIRPEDHPNPVFHHVSLPAAAQQETVSPRTIIPIGMNQRAEQPIFQRIAPTPQAMPVAVSATVHAATMVTSRPRVHIVRSGESLASIAKKYYGSAEGNRKVNVDRIFDANRSRLTSPDAIQLNQRLVIPPLPTEQAVEPVRNLPPVAEPHPTTPARQAGKWYVVKEDESLWKIASSQLGNGSRYQEILKLNHNRLSDPDNLTVGQRLRLPVR